MKSKDMLCISCRPRIGLAMMLFGLFLFLSDVVAQGKDTDKLARAINEIILNERPINFELAPGALIGVFIEDSVYVFGAGKAPDLNALFELGSLTKPVVAYLLRRLQPEHNMSDADLICRFLPDTLCIGNWNQVTIGQLLSHTCGLPKVTGGMVEEEDKINDPYAEYDVEALARDVSHIDPSPGVYRYAHFNYVMLNWVFNTAGGLEAARRNYLEEESGLGSMQFDVPDSVITSGHGMSGVVRPPWHTKAMAPAIGLKSNISDMLHFMQALCKEDIMPKMSRVNKRDLDAKARKGIYETHQGWFLMPYGHELIFFHAGHTGGHQASAAFMAERKIGVAVFTNGASGSGDLSIRVLDLIYRAVK